MAAKFPFPEMVIVRRTGSPTATLFESIEELISKLPMAPVKFGGLPLEGKVRISMGRVLEVTCTEVSRPKPKNGSLKNGSLKNGLLNGEDLLSFVRIKTFER